MWNFFIEKKNIKKNKNRTANLRTVAENLVDFLEEKKVYPEDIEEEFSGEEIIESDTVKRKLIYEKGNLRRGMEYLLNNKQNREILMEDITYYKNGNIKVWISHYSENSFVKEFYEDGKHKRICITENSKIVEEIRYEYYENDRLRNLTSYKNGEKRYIRISRIGKVEEEKITKGTKVKTFTYDDTDILYSDEKYELRIEIQNEIEYVVNIRDASLYTGKFFINIFDEDTMKIVKEEQEYIEGLPHGIWKIYSQNGDILREEIYQNGIKI